MILTRPFRHWSWRVTNRQGSMTMSQCWFGGRGMPSPAAPAACISGEGRRGRCFPRHTRLPGVYRPYVSRLGEAFENGLDRQMTTALRYVSVKRFNMLVIMRGRAQVALHL